MISLGNRCPRYRLSNTHPESHPSAAAQPLNPEPTVALHQRNPALPNRIRVETALSRFPIHCLSRKGAVTIDLQRLNEDGVTDFKWEVTFNSKHGQPGPLAYKIDTLVVNRLLDQMGRPLPGRRCRLYSCRWCPSRPFSRTRTPSRRWRPLWG